MLLFAPLLGRLPMASLAALLLFVAWNMAELDHFAHMLKVAPRSDVAVLLTCFLLTVLFDMVVAVSVGVVLAALLFMRRMAEVSEVRLVDAHPMGLTRPLPKGVIAYEIAGPLFFGAAQKAMAALQSVDKGVRVVILDLRSVPMLDATGLVGLESAFERLHRAGVTGGDRRGPAAAAARDGPRRLARSQGPPHGLRLLRPRGRGSPQGLRVDVPAGAYTPGERDTLRGARGDGMSPR